MSSFSHSLRPLLIVALAGSLVTDAHASGRLELSFGTRIPVYGYWDEPNSAQPALGVEGSLHPRGWPVGITAYFTGAADWYQGQTLSYPGFGDWLTTDNRLLYAAVGAGIERILLVRKWRLSAAGGLLASTTAIRQSRDIWSETRSLRANGEWIGMAASRAVGERLTIGVHARHTWEEYSSPEYEWLKAGGTQVGLTLGLAFSGQ